MRRRWLTTFILLACACVLTDCAGRQERKIEFVYLALGASDATGVGAVPLSNGYVYQIKRELERRRPGVFLINLGVPGAKIDLIKEQVRVAQQVNVKADLVTLWTGANDLVRGDAVEPFQRDLRFVLETLRDDLSDTIVIANLPDLTQLPRFKAMPHRSVTEARIASFNRAIELEAKRVNAKVVDLSRAPIKDEWVSNGDGFHPDNEGHRAIAERFVAVILPVLNQR